MLTKTWLFGLAVICALMMSVGCGTTTKTLDGELGGAGVKVFHEDGRWSSGEGELWYRPAVEGEFFELYRSQIEEVERIKAENRNPGLFSFATDKEGKTWIACKTYAEEDNCLFDLQLGRLRKHRLCV